MSDTDHYYEAEKALGSADFWANKDNVDRDVRTSIVNMWVARAQVHATLALVQATTAQTATIEIT